MSKARDLAASTFTDAITANGGIYLGGTGSSNLQDDYEEGTFNLTVQGSSSNPSTTQTVPGRYTKIGRQVTITANNPTVINTTGASGYITFTGLPFSVSYYAVGNFMSYNGATYAYDGGVLSLAFTDSKIYIYENASNTYYRTVNHNPGSSVLFNLTITYFTS